MDSKKVLRSTERAKEIRRTLMARQYWIIVFLSLANINVAFSLGGGGGGGERVVPAVFIFGDSTSDVGTNNNLKESLARADHPYNGIDFPYSKPTGRFSNGYNTADLIVRLLGYKRSPQPFLTLVKQLSTFKKHVLQGVNFASGGSGILDLTGHQSFKKVIPLGEQIQQFGTVKENITEIRGLAGAERLVSKSLYLFSVGSNDLFDYQRYPSSVSVPMLMATLYDTYLSHLKNMYDQGARKFAIIGVPPIGCCPVERLLNASQCFEEMNDLARAFNTLIEALLQRFSSESSGVKYSLGNAYEMTMEVIDNPYAFGLKNIKTACCGGANFTGELLCTPDVHDLCSVRDEYLFWDWIHPTQAASNLAALTLYGGASEFVKPMNFSQLAIVDV